MSLKLDFIPHSKYSVSCGNSKQKSYALQHIVDYPVKKSYSVTKREAPFYLSQTGRGYYKYTNINF